MTSPLQNRRILVVDDHQPIHEDFRKILTSPPDGLEELEAAEAALLGDSSHRATARATFEVDSAFQGPEALDRVRQALAQGRPYALAFIDVRMPPGWDGIETTARIWQEYPELQVVICTAYSDCSWDEMIAKVGQSDRLVILKKPFDTVEVLQLANALVAKWQLTQQTRDHVRELEERVRLRTQSLESTASLLQAEINERNRMELQLRHAQKMESIGQLAAGIAHEINTPTQYLGDNLRFVMDAFEQVQRVLAHYDQLLTCVQTGTVPADLTATIRSAAIEAELPYLTEEIPKALRQSLDGVERVSKIVRAMKEFSHPGTTEKIPVDLAKAIESTVTVARNEWKYVANLITDFDRCLPPVDCLPGELNQVVLNLVINAAHAIDDAEPKGPDGKGTIWISTRRDGDWAEVRVRDSGTGIPESARARVFDPFFTTKSIGKGSGQGLAIAHSVIVDKHGGSIHFETELGKGTTFVLRLPLRARAPRKEPSP
jgi:two-component system NtrC family sensor kinase